MTHLGLSVDIGPIINQLRDNLLLPCQGCNVQGRVPFLFKHRSTTTRVHRSNYCSTSAIYIRKKRNIPSLDNLVDFSLRYWMTLYHSLIILII